MSPRIHMAAAQATSIDLQYDAIPVRPDEVEQAISAMRRENIRGYSVTMPHKEAVIPFLDELTPAAEALGAVNHITNTDGRLVGNNTDGDGFVLGLEHSTGESVTDKTIGVIGSGGAARAIIDACARHGARQVRVVARSQERALKASTLAGDVGVVASQEQLADCDIVVNATPIGMAHTDGEGQLPCNVDDLSAEAIVVDIVYTPLETPLLAESRRRGLTTVNGLSMLVGQAGEQFSTWTDVEAPLEAMFSAVRRFQQ